MTVYKLGNPKIYVILLNYNGWKDTIECLESILKNDYPNFQIIVVDNDSPNDSMSYIKAWAAGNINSWVPNDNQLKQLSFPPAEKPYPTIFYTKKEALESVPIEEKTPQKQPVILIQAGENRGFSAGNNIGIKYAMTQGDAEFVMVLNNDTVVEKDFLSLLLEKTQESNDFGLIGPKIMHYEHPNNIFSNGGKYNPWTSHVTFLNSGEKDNGQTVSEVSFVSGCAWFIPIKTLNKIGLLDEKYFMYMEDVDFTQTILSHNKKLGIASDSKIFHKGVQSSGGGTSDFSTYWISKNLARYILNNLSTLQKISATSYFFYNALKALTKSILKGRKPKIIIEMKGFRQGVSDKHFSKDKN